MNANTNNTSAKYYEQAKTAYGKYLKFRAWTLTDAFETEKYPIVYSDGHISGNFQSTVGIWNGDLNATTDLPATHDVWAVTAIRQHLTKPHRAVTVIVKTPEEAKDLFDLLVAECKANVPETPKDVWKAIN